MAWKIRKLFPWLRHLIANERYADEKLHAGLTEFGGVYWNGAGADGLVRMPGASSLTTAKYSKLAPPPS